MIYTLHMADDIEGIKNLLSETPILSGLTEADLNEVTGLFTLLHLEAGQILYEVGSQTDGLYVLYHGKVKLSHPDQDDQGKVLIPAETIGEEALLNLPIRKFHAETLEPCDLLFLENSQVNQYLNNKPEVQKTMRVILQSRQLIAKIPMPWLQDDEQVNLMTRKHPIFLLLNTLYPILAFAAVVLLITGLGSGKSPIELILLVATFILCLLWLAWNINNWANDFYLITNKRMVWVERISGFYDSRQEAPLGTLVSVGIKTSQMGAMLDYSDVLVRTYIGDIRFSRVGNPRQVGKLIELYWSKSKVVDQTTEAQAMRSIIRRKFGKEGEQPVEKGTLDEHVQEPGNVHTREISFFEWLFSDFLKVRYEVGGTTTYRKHWFVLIKKSFLPLLGLVLSIVFVVAVVTRNFTSVNYNMAMVLGVFLMVAMSFYLVYVYVDWKNDIFQLTPNQVIDIDRRPFGRESRRSAPLDSILSIEYERRGIIPILFNFGTVFITIGNTQLTFNDVYQPSQVQQDIFTRMGAHTEEKQQREIEQERERAAQWFKVYHEETQAEDDTQVLRKSGD